MALVRMDVGSDSGNVSIAHYRNGFEKFRNVEEEKNKFIEELLEKLESTMKRLEQVSTVEIPQLEAGLSVKLKDLEIDIQDQKDSRRRWQAKAEKAEDTLDMLVGMNEKSRFVSVLIDADADIYYLADEFISQGLKGGQAAADKLVEKVREHLVSLGPRCKDAKTIPIIVKAYANLTGLANHFKTVNKASDIKEVIKFWAGFSQRHPFIDFVDIGYGKEAADNKIRENLQMNLVTPQCQQIYLACVHDGGYVPVLSPYAGQVESHDRITLVSAGPGSVHPSIADLGFRSTDVFAPIFAQSNSPRVEQWKKSTIAPSEAPATTVAKKSDSPAPLTWSTKAQLPTRTSPTTSPVLSFTKVTRKASPPAASKRISEVPYNPLDVDFTGEYFVENAGRLIPKAKDTAGNRLRDNNLIVHKSGDYELIGKMKKMSLCQWHYLRSDCSNHRKDKCIRNHDTYPRPLEPKEYDALWCLSRMGYCKKLENEGYCNDDYCIYGHDE